jgi:hypothetical protein
MTCVVPWAYTVTSLGSRKTVPSGEIDYVTNGSNINEQDEDLLRIFVLVREQAVSGN